jgi:hypothetical protein
MFNHYDRREDNINNENLDSRRTHLNYNLAPAHDSQGDFIRQRCDGVRVLNRKDVNVMVSWVLTAPADLPETDRRKFFQEGYAFMADRYGGEKNVVSAYVHMDEVSPHMHFAFVPVVADKKRGGEKLSAHEAVNRKDLQTFHKDLTLHMERVFGRDIGIENGAVKANGGNLSIPQLRQAAERASIERDRAIQERDEVIQETARAAAERAKEKGETEIARKEKNALEEEIRGLTAQKAEWLSSLRFEKDITAVGEAAHTIFGEAYIKCKPSEFAELQKAAIGNFALAIRAQTAEKTVTELEKKIETKMISRSAHDREISEIKFQHRKKLQTVETRATSSIAFINEKGLDDKYKAWIDANRQQEKPRSRGMER